MLSRQTSFKKYFPLASPDTIKIIFVKKLRWFLRPFSAPFQPFFPFFYLNPICNSTIYDVTNAVCFSHALGLPTFSHLMTHFRSKWCSLRVSLACLSRCKMASKKKYCRLKIFPTFHAPPGHIWRLNAFKMATRAGVKSDRSRFHFFHRLPIRPLFLLICTVSRCRRYS